ncbi:hypothetical protein BGW38_010812 [Lunasporangiospora selenospora]|uniref:Uncharacterized protein n=1 Tax=Lunasporangiospora selenospora TaxID=979761 RepID=A0A9P6KHQ4_9FUNG|nr:hypothetical protein BGW38_010812 [Lunasporangiospora selenospora]
MLTFSLALAASVNLVVDPSSSPEYSSGRSPLYSHIYTTSLILKRKLFELRVFKSVCYFVTTIIRVTSKIKVLFIIVVALINKAFNGGDETWCLVLCVPQLVPRTYLSLNCDLKGTIIRSKYFDSKEEFIKRDESGNKGDNGPFGLESTLQPSVPWEAFEGLSRTLGSTTTTTITPDSTLATGSDTTLTLRTPGSNTLVGGTATTSRAVQHLPDVQTTAQLEEFQNELVQFRGEIVVFRIKSV